MEEALAKGLAANTGFLVDYVILHVQSFTSVCQMMDVANSSEHTLNIFHLLPPISARNHGVPLTPLALTH